MSKSEVEENRLSEYVVMPTECDLSFMEWWKTKTPNDQVSIRYPHSRHGNAGKSSNRAKKDAKADFLEFIDCNSQPNGRNEESSSATHFFLPKFRTIQTPKDGVPRYEQHMRESLVAEFNRVQREKGRDTISNYSGSTWLKKERPKYAISPHKLDYCDTCAKVKEKIRAAQTTLSRIRQSGSASTAEQNDLETRISSLNADLISNWRFIRMKHTNLISII